MRPATPARQMADRTAWQITSSNGWWSTFGKRRRGKGGKVGPPVHDDLVERDFGRKLRAVRQLPKRGEVPTGSVGGRRGFIVQTSTSPSPSLLRSVRVQTATSPG
jgi:hypothetical protein